MGPRPKGGNRDTKKPEIAEKIDADELANSLSFVPDVEASSQPVKKSRKPELSLPDAATEPLVASTPPKPRAKPKKKTKHPSNRAHEDFDSDDLPTPVNEPVDVAATVPAAVPTPPPSPSRKTKGGRSWTWKDVVWVSLALIFLGSVFWLKVQEEAWSSTAGLARESENFYEVLHLEKTATAGEVKKAYKKLAVLLHPDKNSDCPECAEKFAAVARAYETLGNADKRRIYDETRGAFESLPSDFSTDLTVRNFHELVTLSPDLWLVQVFSDVDGSSRQFAPFWESVAMEFHGKLKFGRINVRTNRDAASLLPVRARNFPTVLLLAKNQYPAIFPLNDLSREAFRAWIARETPDVFLAGLAAGLAASGKPLVVLETTKPPSLDVKLAALNWQSVFDFQVRTPQTGISTRPVFRLGEMPEIFGEAGKHAEVTLAAFARRFAAKISRENAERLCRGVYCVGSASRKAPEISRSHMQVVWFEGEAENFIYDLDDELIVRGNVKDATIEEILVSENPDELIEDLLFQPFARQDFRSLLPSEIPEPSNWKFYLAIAVSALAGLFGLFQLSRHVDLKPLLFVLLGASLVVSAAPWLSALLKQ